MIHDRQQWILLLDLIISDVVLMVIFSSIIDVDNGILVGIGSCCKDLDGDDNDDDD